MAVVSATAPAHADNNSPAPGQTAVPVPIVDAVAVSLNDRAKRQKAKPGSVILALYAVRRLEQTTVVYYSVTIDASPSASPRPCS